MENRTYEDNSEAIEAWNTVLFDKFTRFRHLLTVHRIIGLKTGTGGSSGVPFLRRALDVRFFPELWDVRTELEPPR